MEQQTKKKKKTKQDYNIQDIVLVLRWHVKEDKHVTEVGFEHVFYGVLSSFFVWI